MFVYETPPEFEELKRITRPCFRRQKYVPKLLKFLLGFQLFQNIYQRRGQSNLVEIARKFVFKEYEFSQIIYNEPDVKRTFNYIVRGTVMLFTTNSPDLAPVFYKRVSSDQYFGERVYVNPKVGDIVMARSVSQCFVIELDIRTLYITFTGYFSFRELENKINELRAVNIFQNISTRRLEYILQVSTLRKVLKGSVLFKEGQEAQHMYVVMKGEFCLKKKVLEGEAKILTSRSFVLSIIGRYQELGFQEIDKGTSYFSTAVCESQEAEVLQIAKEIVDHAFQAEKDLRLSHEKQQWRKQRVKDYSQTRRLRTEESHLKSQDRNSKSTTFAHRFMEMAADLRKPLEFDFEDREKLVVTEMSHRKFRKSVEKEKSRTLSELINRNGQSRKESHFSGSSSRIARESNTGDELFQSYIRKKYKSNYITYLRYLLANPPQLVENPDQQFAPVKPLFLRKSQAVKNTKRQLKASRRKLKLQMSVG